MVNAVLRKFVAQRAALLETVDHGLAARHAHPPWLVDRLREAWGDRAETILAANNQHPPMVLRLDQTQLSRADFMTAWRAQGRDARAVDWNADALVLEHPVAVQLLPGFDSGAVSVQDAAAQLAAPLLDARPDMRVLDACAAPGGKTLHIAQRTAGLRELVAVDHDPVRLQRVRDNLERAGRDALLVAADMCAPVPSLAPGSFDRVLVDAPCSGTGVIRRHPDIKLLRRPADIAAFAVTQERILRAAFELLRPGGRLLYCTCSVLPEENEGVVGAFLANEPAAARADWTEGLAQPPGLLSRAVGWQLLPGGGAGTDGFYYAGLTKTHAPG
jgi:16S rRNA (cytosine967-C5)-methyltransferase